MILSIHSIAGAVLASNSNSFGQVIALGIVSHYFLDSIPHLEYKISSIQRGELKTAIKEFAKIFVDLLIGLIIILYVIQSNNPNQLALILTGAFFALFPDGLYFLDCMVKNKDRNIFTPAPNKHQTLCVLAYPVLVLVRGFTKFLKLHTVFHKKTHSTISNKLITIPSQITIALFLIYIIFK